MASGASPSATRLSWGSLSKAYKAYRKASPQGLARIWLLVGIAMSVVKTGCVFPEPPDYQRKSTPPFLWLPLPSTFGILSAKVGDPPLSFSVLVRSEDADGDELFAFLYTDYQVKGETTQADFSRVAPGTINDERPINVSWSIPQYWPSGCVQLTLVVSHRSNFDKNNYPIDDADVATMTWWANINDSADTLAQCPRSSGGPL